MKLSRQEEIALLLTSELAGHHDTYVSLSDIAERHGISMLFLKKIARMLKKQGLIVSKEGSNGGYALQRSASDISAWSVLEAANGKSGDADVTHPHFKCPLQPSCVPQTIRHLISEAFKRYLSDVTIDQFLDKRRI